MDLDLTTLPGDQGATLEVDTDLPGGPLSLPLSATIYEPQLTITPGAVAFGDLRTDAAAVGQTLSLENTGAVGPVKISRISLAGDGAFSLTAPPATPLVLATGAVVTVRIEFDPDQAKDLSAQLTIVSDDLDQSTSILDVTGRGGALGPRGA